MHERCLRGVVRHRSLCGAGKAVWVRAWGSGLCRACVICSCSYSQVNGFGFREKAPEDLAFRRYRRGVG